MPELPKRSEIKKGMKVFVELKQDQGSGKLTEGIVKDILTPGDHHPYGIMVELDDGGLGRVKTLFENNVVESKKNTSETKTDVNIPKDEDTWNEFKSTFRLDLKRFENGDKKKVQSKDVEKEIPVTISAMANKEGGTLFIGIDDNGKILGLEKDYDLLQKPNDDKLQRMIWQTIQNYINNISYVSKLEMSLITKESKKICIIKIPPSDEPIFVHENHTQESYVRIGSKSEKFTPVEFMKYCKTRFKD